MQMHETPLIDMLGPPTRLGYVRLAHRPADGTLVMMLNGRFLREACFIHISEVPSVTILLPFLSPDRMWLGRIIDRIVWWWYGIPYRIPPDLHVWYTPLPTGYTGGGITRPGVRLYHVGYVGGGRTDGSLERFRIRTPAPPSACPWC